MSDSTQNRSFRRRVSKPISWLGTKNLTQQQHTFINQKECTTTQNKLNTGLVAFYNIRPGNGAGLFSKEKISKEADR